IRHRIGYQIANQGPLGQRFDGDSYWTQLRNAGVFHLAVNQRHTGFARVGVDATVTDRQRAIEIYTDPAERIENRHAVFVGDFEVFITALFVCSASPYAENRLFNRSVNHGFYRLDTITGAIQ